jgi:hypothetical protein
MSPIDDILYPAIEPYHSDYLQVSALHQLYFEQYGQPQGIPVLFVHGGPGGGCEPMHRRFFDPQAYIVLFDQRGAGRSPPMAELTDNTTPHLIADIERLRQHLGIERWLVFGRSWGSILGLAFQRQKVLLYFYPKDNTLGCTKEACAFRDQWRAFQQLNVAILGVSIDDEQSHQSFAKKYALPFTLLADPEEALVQTYGAWGEKSLYGKKYMGTDTQRLRALAEALSGHTHGSET